MRTQQVCWNAVHGWRASGANRGDANLEIYFGTRAALADGARYGELPAMIPGAHILGCTTGGQIRNDDVSDDEVVAVAVSFDATRLQLACEPAPSPDRSRRCGEAIGRALKADDLAGIFVLSDGLNVNGSELDRDARSMNFAGDVPEGWMAQLMRGSFGRLAAGAAEAARQARAGLGKNADRDGMAVLVSCIGRRLLMGQRTMDEVEVEAAGHELGSRLPRIGFYSYGEIAPHGTSGMCELHNQIMTVTAITEAA